MARLNEDEPLTVIIPVYNEGPALKTAVNEIKTHILKKIPTASLLIINDGSTDTSKEIISDLVNNHAQIHAIHKHNEGHGPTIIAGINKVTTGYMLLLDSDNQIALDDFETAWNEKGRDTVVVGIRKRRKDPLQRIVLSLFIRLIIRLLFGKGIPRDANVPYKLFHKNFWDTCKDDIPPETNAPSLFLALCTKRKDYTVKEMEVCHKERAHGSSKIRHFKLFVFCAKSLVQLLTFHSSYKKWIQTER